MGKLFYAAFSVLCFGVGVYVWKIKNTGAAQTPQAEVAPPQEDSHPTGTVVDIAGSQVTEADVDWEYDLVTDGILNNEELTPIPNLGPRYKEEMKPLRKQLVANIIERKVLFAFVQQDKGFFFDDPGRYNSCMNDWQETIKTNEKAFSSKESRARLRTRLCERSVLDQYLKEKVFSAVAVVDAEALEYYKNHRAEYKRPERVTIKQVVLATEGEAKKVRAQINSSNFEEVARAKSIAPEGVDGGRLGPFTKSAIPSIFDLAYGMKKGEISPIMKTPYGYHIITLVEKFPRSELGFDEVKDRVTAALRTKKQEDEYQKWVEKALASVAVNTPKPLW